MGHLGDPWGAPTDDVADGIPSDPRPEEILCRLRRGSRHKVLHPNLIFFRAKGRGDVVLIAYG